MSDFDNSISWVMRTIYYPIATVILTFSLILWISRLLIVIFIMSIVIAFANYKGSGESHKAIESIKRVASIGPELISRLWGDPWGATKSSKPMAYGLAAELFITIMMVAILYFSLIYYSIALDYVKLIYSSIFNTELPGFYLYISSLSLVACIISISVLILFKNDENLQSILYWASLAIFTAALCAIVLHAYSIKAEKSAMANEALRAALEGGTLNTQPHVEPAITDVGSTKRAPH